MKRASGSFQHEVLFHVRIEKGLEESLARFLQTSPQSKGPRGVLNMIFCSLLGDEFLGRDDNLHRRYMKRGAECSWKNAGVGSVIRELGGGVDESLAPRFVAIL